MKKIILIIPLLLVALLTGCYDYEEINDRAMVIGLAFDKDNTDYITSIQILYIEPSSGQQATGGTYPTTYTGRGKSIYEALSQVTLVAPRYLCFTHVQLIVIQQELAKEGVMNILDFFMRHFESRQQFQVLISRDNTAKDILTIHTTLETFPVFNIIKSVDVGSLDHGMSNAITYDEFLSNILKEGIHPVIPGIMVTGDEEEGNKRENTEKVEADAKIMVTTLAAFKNDKLIDWLNIDESWGYNIASGNTREKVLSFPCDDNNYASARITKANPSIKVKVDGNNIKPTISIDVAGRMSEINCPLELDKPNVLIDLDKKAEKEIKRLIETTITKSKELNSDILGIGREIYLNNPKQWEELKNDWDSIFPTLEYEVKVNASIIRRGLLEDTIYMGDQNE